MKNQTVVFLWTGAVIAALSLVAPGEDGRLAPVEGDSSGALAPLRAQQLTLDERTPISSLPFTINNCGSYFLTKCLTGTSGSHGITVDSDDVTIDLNGFALRGVAGSLDGIHIQPGMDRVSVFGGNIRDWGQSGISAADSGRHHFRDLRIDDNGDWGIDVRRTALVDGCSAFGNGESGIRVQEGGVISNSMANSNGLNGSGNGFAVSLVNDGAAVIAQCLARDNTGDGATAGRYGQELWMSSEEVHAATLVPSLNCTPRMTSPRSRCPLSFRHLRSAA